jgi:hypothetical protein
MSSQTSSYFRYEIHSYTGSRTCSNNPVGSKGLPEACTVQASKETGPHIELACTCGPTAAIRERQNGSRATEQAVGAAGGAAAAAADQGAGYAALAG